MDLRQNANHLGQCVLSRTDHIVVILANLAFCLRWMGCLGRKISLYKFFTHSYTRKIFLVRVCMSDMSDISDSI